jgi:RNA-directed DNA polymerase
MLRVTICPEVKGVSLETTIAELAPYMRGWRNYFGFCETPEATCKTANKHE